MSVAGIIAGGIAHRLPEGASATAMPVLRPLPGGAGRLCVGLLGGGALPAWVLPGAALPARAWALVPGPEGALLLGGDELTDSPPADAAPVPPPPFPQPRLRLTRPAQAEPEAGLPAMVRGGFRLNLPGGALDIPFAALGRLVPMPALHPVPNPPPGTRGMAWTEAGPVLVLDPGHLGRGGGGEARLLALVLSEGRQLGLPCLGATPVAEAPPLPDLLAAPGLLAAAPLARSLPVAESVPMRWLLIARASGARFALPLEEVAAVLPPQLPRNQRGAQEALAGIAAHRGDVLPVLDAGLRLGRAPVLAGSLPTPMLRLQGSRPVALAVSSVTGLRSVPEADLAPVEGAGLVSAIAHLDGDALPVCRAAMMAAPLGGYGP
ncbi:chemotaxis protein CheW [Roseomonas xinghualingensis]|uniref:chemotaxis protein CheW n=1 Tax=Roseomonas xinghualingensis TaxID=2986475 RepID=UPI0021F2091C|nr:chemotaxis protein CheW [Roseomonas sp. SXEYE001]MCV4208922.1 chemotaxis protein CheW [Roseomonas sp. SXEYE001]